MKAFNKDTEKKEIVNDTTLISSKTEKFSDISKQEDIQKWIRERIKPADKLNRKFGSYHLKHICEGELGFRVGHYDFKYAMCMAGIKSIRSSNSNFVARPKNQSYYTTTDYDYYIQDVI